VARFFADHVGGEGRSSQGRGHAIEFAGGDASKKERMPIDVIEQHLVLSAQAHADALHALAASRQRIARFPGPSQAHRFQPVNHGLVEHEAIQRRLEQPMAGRHVFG
jgi:hypothetical protein